MNVIVISFKVSEIFSEIQVLTFDKTTDKRGSFLKILNKDLKKEFNFSVDEVFLSTSVKDVVRGMHLQNNNFPLEKIVYCNSGSILDVVIDLRPESSTYGKWETFLLEGSTSDALFIPKGFGHGFKAISELAEILYLQSGYYNKDSELGINPLTFGYNWEIKNPIVSDRDLNLPNLSEFNLNE